MATASARVNILEEIAPNFAPARTDGMMVYDVLETESVFRPAHVPAILDILDCHVRN